MVVTFQKLTRKKKNEKNKKSHIFLLTSFLKKGREIRRSYSKVNSLLCSVGSDFDVISVVIRHK